MKSFKINIGILLLILLTATFSSLPAEESVALMFPQRFNNGWNAANDNEALLLGSQTILADAIHDTGIRLGNWNTTTNLFNAAKSGFYLRSPDEEDYSYWQKLVRADVYIEADLDKERILWRALLPGGKEINKRVDAPLKNPGKVAAALVELVFESTGTALPKELEAALAKPPTKHPELFFEWAKWIGYHPHWTHEAPWDGPRNSALRIIQRDPEFRRGMAWAVPTMRRRARTHTSDPTAEEFFQHAFFVLDSPHAGSVLPVYTEWLKAPARQKEAIAQLGLLALDVDLDAGPAASGLEDLTGSKGSMILNKNQLPTGPLFRTNLVRALATVESEEVRKALILAAQTDDAREVRAAAVVALGGFSGDAMTDTLRQILEKDKDAEVRAAAAKELLKKNAFEKDAIAQLLQDPEAMIRRSLSENLRMDEHAKLDPAAIWEQLLADAEADVRLSALRRLSEEKLPVSTDARNTVLKRLQEGNEKEQISILQWLRTAGLENGESVLLKLLDAPSPTVRAEAARTLQVTHPQKTPLILEKLQGASRAETEALIEVMVQSKDPQYHSRLLELLPTLPDALAMQALDALYVSTAGDRKARIQFMRNDPSMRVNFSAIDMALRLDEKPFTEEFLFWCATEHANEYVRSRALRELQSLGSSRLREASLAGLASPFWVVRLDAADLLAAVAEPGDAGAIDQALEQTDEKWLTLALEDAKATATGSTPPERIHLNLGNPGRMEGGDTPNGFQVWLGWLPEDRNEARKMVDEGYRFGRKPKEPDVPGGANLSSFNNDRGMRNIYVQESILDALEGIKQDLPLLYYLALFDEPVSIGVGNNPDNIRAFLIETGHPELIARIKDLPVEELLNELPAGYAKAFEYHWTRNAGNISNWVVQFYRTTAQRIYPDLRIFPHTLSYMWGPTMDAVDSIDADGDYSWVYHNHQVIADGSLGAINRVVHPGKPILRVTWMGWWRPNILYGDSIATDTEFPEGPWRYRNYMGYRSSLALWAGGAEAGFFNFIGLKPASDKKAQGTSRHPFHLKPWSKEAIEAVDILMADEAYWKSVDGKLGVQELAEKKEAPTIDLQGSSDLDDFDALLGDSLKEGLSPLEEAKEKRRQELMAGISYMNLYNTDVSRALSNLPNPDTKNRDTLVIVGRDTDVTSDGATFFTPSLAVIQGYDMAPNYSSVSGVDLLQYDTLILQPSRDGVTPDLVRSINRWLEQKKGGLLIVGGALSGKNPFFPMIYTDPAEETFLWESSVQSAERERITETYEDNRKREQKRTTWARLESFVDSEGKKHVDDLTRVRSTFQGEITPLATGAENEVILARWKSPESVQNTVVFDGAAEAGPIYTETLESVILALDKERGSSIQRNTYWGHLIYENDQFVIDVASAHLASLVEARPRKLKGVDIITGDIHPTVNRGEAALVLKDYVGPYAGAKGNWAVLAREALRSMELDTPSRLSLDTAGVVRVSHIGKETLRLASTDGFEEVKDQIQVWERMQKGKPAYSINPVEGGMELHYFSPEPVVLIAE